MRRDGHHDRTHNLRNNRPSTLANAYLAGMDWAKFTGDGDTAEIHSLLLRHWRDDFYAFEQNVYRKLNMEEMTADLCLFLNDQRVGPNARPLLVKQQTVRETMAQLRAKCQVKGIESMPMWLNDQRRTDPKNILAFRNGLIDIRNIISDGLHVAPIPCTPEWFSESVIACNYDPRAKCPLWLKFLDDVLDGDKQLIALLQQWFGYCLVPDGSQQKMLWLHGRSGAGKSTIAKVLAHVVGAVNTVNFSLWDFTQRFTLSAFLGKTLAISADAHLSKDTDSLRVIEQIKAITGQDDRLIDRKNRELLPGIQLAVRFVISVNKFPTLPDAGDTLRRRSLIIPFDKSFEGAEDRDLANKLIAETAGIAIWAINGLRELRETGRFIKTDRGEEMQNELSRLTNPIMSFVEDYCDVPEVAEGVARPVIRKDRLYKAYKHWCEASGHRPMAKETFGQVLLHTPLRTEDGKPAKVTQYRPKFDDGSRQNCYRGLSLNTVGQEASPQTTDDQRLFTEGDIPF